VCNVGQRFIIPPIYQYKSIRAPVPLKYGKLATKYPRIWGYFNICTCVCALYGDCCRYPVVPIDGSEMVDTVGAGDSYAGGFLAQFVTGADTATCVAAGAYAANYILRRRCCNIDLNHKPDIHIDRRRRTY